MRILKSIIKWTLLILAGLYTLVCFYFYFQQEKIIFPAHKLPPDYKFVFEGRYEERKIIAPDGAMLSGILFKSDSSRGLIFYLHGNAGSLDTWGSIASAYTKLHYDIFMLDYRGYGKSEGKISSEMEFFHDVQCAYADLAKEYPENKIVVIGYSIGTGSAAMLASRNHPRLLILQAPYYSLSDLSRKSFPILPGFLLKYKFNTHEFLSKTKTPVVIFHGDADEVIYYGSSLKLKETFKTGDQLITLKGQGHNGFTHNPEYVEALQRIL